MQETIKATLALDLKKAGINISSAILDQLALYIDDLLITNQSVNLTSITDEQEAAYKHLYDALLISKILQFQEAQKIIDIGSGAGIPAIPLAIAYPDKTIYSLEATQKKVNFQLNIKEKLKLDNFFPLWNRAEVLAHDPHFRGQFDLVTARAVASMNVLLELMLPFTKLNAFCILYKGKDANVEIEAAQKGLNTLHSRVTTIFSDLIPYDYGERNLIVIQKKALTPGQFPRKPGIPQKKPLS